jgi:hypothetical protein
LYVTGWLWKGNASYFCLVWNAYPEVRSNQIKELSGVTYKSPFQNWH